MTVVNVHSTVPGSVGENSRALTFGTDADFGDKLTLGQIIKGKVLRHYEGNRYAVRFGGHEKVVDSAIPLRVGDQVQGRVIRLDDKVHLQRVLSSAFNEAQSVKDGGAALQNRGLSGSDQLPNFLDKFLASLSKSELAAFTKLQSKLDATNLGASALIVRKLGLPLDPVLVRAVQRVMAQLESAGGSTFYPGVQLEAGSDDKPESVLIQGLAPLLNRISDLLTQSIQDQPLVVTDPQKVDSGSLMEMNDQQGGDEGREQENLAEWQLGMQILNGQTESSIAHRVLLIPLWFGERMVELSLALFAEQGGASAQQGSDNALRYRKAVFSLSAENLGKVQIEAKTADRHLSLRIGAENVEVADVLSSQLSVLTDSLAEWGWAVDEIRYEVGGDDLTVPQAVIEHHYLQDSLSRVL